MKTNTKIALVTGGSRGLGKEMALQLAQSGIKVVVTYKSNKEAADETVNEIKEAGSDGFALALDTSRSATFDGFYEALQKSLKALWGVATFDILVNNAGIIAHSLAAETTEDTFDALQEVQLKGPYFLTQKSLPILNDGGRIINISTGLTRFSLPGYSAYAAMKAGIEAYTRYLAKELGGRQITANVVAPGAIDTDMNKDAMRNPKFVETISSVTALGRVGKPDDIAGVVTFLASDASKWVNGQRIEASGGMFL